LGSSACLGASDFLGASSFLGTSAGLDSTGLLSCLCSALGVSDAFNSGSYSIKLAPTSIFCFSEAKIFVITPDATAFISTYYSKINLLH
jgi:hypothetical protein